MTNDRICCALNSQNSGYVEGKILCNRILFTVPTLDLKEDTYPFPHYQDIASRGFCWARTK